jgi:starvation-inducible DNA-binding protein
MKLNIGLTEHDGKGVAHILNENLCDEYVLYTKTRNCHWNVTGPAFASLHRFLERQYGELDEIVDSVAERVRSVGGWAMGTLAEFSGKTKLKEHPGVYPDAESMLEELAADHEAVIRRLRGDLVTCDKKYHDAGTCDFLTGLMERHEKMAWMLRAHLRAGSRTARSPSADARGGLDLGDDLSGAGE